MAERKTAGSPARRLRALFCLACFALTTWAATGVVRGLVPWPESDERAARWHFFRTSDDYDVLIVGSSNLRHGLDPRVLDRTLAARGHLLHSFSLAAEGMHVIEADVILREVVAEPRPRLRYVLIELLPHSPLALIGPNHFSDPVQFWHTAAGTRFALRALARARAPLQQRAALGWLHLRHAGRRWGSVGQGPRIVAGTRASQLGDVGRIASNRGFTALDALDDERYDIARRSFLRELDKWEQRVGQIDDRHEWALQGHPVRGTLDLVRVREQIEWVRDLGAEPVFLVPPVPAATPDVLAAANSGKIPNVLAFNSPGRYPELYRTENRFDFSHLNGVGAERWSEIVGERLAAWIDARNAGP